MAQQSPAPLSVVVVTDPMCSWCWGMAAETERARRLLAGNVDFQLLLGGVNLHATQKIGNYGRRHLYHIWREVEATTGQPFAYALPPEAVYNSRLPAMAVRAYARAQEDPGFAMLHQLQEAFFAQGLDINNAQTLAAQAEQLRWDGEAMLQALADPELAKIVQWEFDNSRQFGTSALPNLLVERDGQRRLLAGGYLDCEMLASLVEPLIATVH